MGFQRNERVEVCSKEEGFIGSYYAATIIDQVINNNNNNKISYVVQYDTLLEENESRPLIETVKDYEVRPMPPKKTSDGFVMFETVDAFDNDGWWVGKMTGRVGLKYFVYFDTTGDEIGYPSTQLRVHHEWINGK